MILATLLYVKNNDGDYLLLKRKRNPNKNLLSPPGGKLDLYNSESPVECAVREAFEECSIYSNSSDWKLMGIVTEKNYPGAGNIMIFLMEYSHRLDKLPPPCNEGEFYFVSPEQFENYDFPETDKKFIWEKVLEFRDNVFHISLDCTEYPEIKETNI